MLFCRLPLQQTRYCWMIQEIVLSNMYLLGCRKEIPPGYLPTANQLNHKCICVYWALCPNTLNLSLSGFMPKINMSPPASVMSTQTVLLKLLNAIGYVIMEELSMPKQPPPWSAICRKLCRKTFQCHKPILGMKHPLYRRDNARQKSRHLSSRYLQHQTKWL